MDRLTERAGVRFPNLPVFPYFRGLAKLENGDDRGAERQLKMARNLIVDRPEFESDVLSTLAQIAHDRGDHAESDQWFEQALEANPTNLLALNNYAYYLAVRGAKPERSVELAAQVVALSPGNGNFEDTYAWALHKAGDHTEALTWIDLAIAHEGDSPGATVLEHAGDILDALGRREEARASRSASTSGPKSPMTKAMWSKGRGVIAARSSTRRWTMGLPATWTRGFGTVRVCGRRRLPRPAMGMMRFIRFRCVRIPQHRGR